MHVSGRKTPLALAAVSIGAILAFAVSGCAFVKPGSLSLGQPQGIGTVRVHFVLCTLGGTEEACGANEESGEVQYLIGVAVPPGSTPPESFSATPVGSGSPIVFNRNEEVASEMTAASAALQTLIGEGGAKEKEEAAKFKELIGGPWPPNGLQGVGYLSQTVNEVTGQSREWSVDPEFGLPGASGGKPFTGPFAAGIAFGVRVVEPSNPGSRAVRCFRTEKGATPNKGESFCSGSIQEAQLGIANLLIAPPAKPARAFVGGTGQVSFQLRYGGAAPAIPSFALSAASTAKGAKAVPGSKSFTPKPTDASTHLSPSASGAVTVKLPRGVKAGTYDVTLTARTPQGGTTSGVAKLKVVKPKLKFGGLKPGSVKGTATLPVKVPGAGKLTIGGRGVAGTSKRAKKAKTLKMKIAATGSAAAQLARTGSVKLKLKATFKPSSGISVSKRKTVLLKLRG